MANAVKRPKGQCSKTDRWGTEFTCYAERPRWLVVPFCEGCNDSREDLGMLACSQHIGHVAIRLVEQYPNVHKGMPTSVIVREVREEK